MRRPQRGTNPIASMTSTVSVYPFPAAAIPGHRLPSFTYRFPANTAQEPAVHARYDPALDVIVHASETAGSTATGRDEPGAHSGIFHRIVQEHENGHLLLHRQSTAWARMFLFNIIQNLVFIDTLQAWHDPGYQRMLPLSADATASENQLAWLGADQYQQEYIITLWEPLQESFANVVSAERSPADTATVLTALIRWLQQDGPTLDIAAALDSEPARNWDRYCPIAREHDPDTWETFSRSYQLGVLETVLALYENCGAETAVHTVKQLATAASNLEHAQPPSTVFWRILEHVATLLCETPHSTPKNRLVRLLSMLLPDRLKQYVIRWRYGITPSVRDPRTVPAEAAALCDAIQKLKTQVPDGSLWRPYLTVLPTVFKQRLHASDPLFFVVQAEGGQDHRLLVPHTVEQSLREHDRPLIQFHYGLTLLRQDFIAAFRAADTDLPLSRYTTLPWLDPVTTSSLEQYHRLATHCIAEYRGQRSTILQTAKTLFQQNRRDGGFLTSSGIGTP